MNMASKLFVVSAVVAGITACGGAPEMESMESTELGESQAALQHYPDGQPDPAPQPTDVVPPNLNVLLSPGYIACYERLWVTSTAGIEGRISLQGVPNPPRVLVFRAPDYAATPSKVSDTPITPDSLGNFQFTVNRRNIPSGSIPGIFTFCVRNPSANTQRIIFSAHTTNSTL